MRQILGQIGLFVALAIPAFAGLKKAGDWQYRSNEGGMVFYETQDEQGDKFSISCADSVKTEMGAGIFIVVGPWAAPGNQMVSFDVDGSKFLLPTDQNGNIASDSHMASQAFEVAWQTIRRGKQMAVSFPAGQRAVFSLRGASSIMPAKNCKTTFDRQVERVRQEEVGASSESDVGERVRSFCRNKWPSDYEMELYCVEQQTEAARKLGY
jgi:hypothetical protein